MPSDSDAAAAAANGAAAPPPESTAAAAAATAPDAPPADGAAALAAAPPAAAGAPADGAATTAAAAAPPRDPAAEAKAKAAADAAAAARAADDAALAAGARVRAMRAALAHAFTKPAPSPPRPPDHWDYLLAEAAWMKADFDGERAWKAAAAAACALAAAAVDWPAKLTATAAGREYRADAAAFRAADDGRAEAAAAAAAPGKDGTRSAAPPSPATPPRLTYTLPPAAPAALAAALEADAHDRRVAHLISVRQYEDDLAAARRAAAAAAAAARAAAEAEADALRAASARARALGRRASLAGTDSGRLSDSDLARGAAGGRRDRKRGRGPDDDALSLAPRPAGRASGARAPDPRRASGRAGRAGRPGPGGRPATGPAALGAPWTPADDVLLCAVVHEFGSNWALVGDVLTGSAALRGAVRSGAACRARFRALTHPGDPASLDAGVSEEGVAAAASITKASARDLLVRALPVPDAALGAAARAAGAAFNAARHRRAAEEARGRDMAAARGGASHASHAAVAAAALATRGGVPPQPADLVDAAEAAATRVPAPTGASTAPAAAAAGAAGPAGGGGGAAAAGAAGGGPPRHTVTVAQVQEILRTGRLPDGRELTAQLRAALTQRVRAAQAAAAAAGAGGSSAAG